MKLLLHNTINGLIPCYDSDYDEKKKLKLGETYKATLVVPRNILFHNKFFVLRDRMWDLMKQCDRDLFYDNKERFRESLTMYCGYVDEVFDIELSKIVLRAKSISFSSMSESTFNDFYTDFYNKGFQKYLSHITEENFINNLNGF